MRTRSTPTAAIQMSEAPVKGSESLFTVGATGFEALAPLTVPELLGVDSSAGAVVAVSAVLVVTVVVSYCCDPGDAAASPAAMPRTPRPAMMLATAIHFLMATSLSVARRLTLAERPV